MAKRAATTELNHDNWDKDPSSDEEAPGKFQLATSDEMSKRKIIVAKRSRNAADEPTKPSLFGGFTGFGLSKPSGTTVRTEPLVFGKKASPPRTSFHPPKNTSDNVTPVNATVAETKTPEKPATENGDRSEFCAQLKTLNQEVIRWMQTHFAENPYLNFTPVFNDYKTQFDDLQKKYSTMKSTATSEKTNGTSSQTLSALIPEKPKPSETVTSSDKPPLSTTSPILFPAFKFTSQATDQKVESVSKASFDFSSLQPSKATIPSSGHKSQERQVSRFGAVARDSAEAKPATVAPLFTTTLSDNPAKKLFSFGALDKPTQGAPTSLQSFTSNTTPFTFSSSSSTVLSTDASAKPPLQFSFASSSKAPAFSHESGDADGATDEPYEPPKAEILEIEEKDAYYSLKCKLFYKKDSKFAEKGVGTLYLKSLPDEKTQLLIRASNSLGNILLNIIVKSSIPCQRTKNNVTIVCIANPPIETKEDEKAKVDAEPTVFLIRVKSDDEAIELHEKIKSAK